MSDNLEHGDYQTPQWFADKVCRYLRDHARVRPSAVVEPTCGDGSFLRSALALDASEYLGIEASPAHCAVARRLQEVDPRVRIVQADIFSCRTRPLVRDEREVLVLGNPPWVLSSTLAGTGPDNLPEKSNFKALPGLDARTGAGNFDVCESVILRLVDEYAGTNALFCMLCKPAVARSVYAELDRRRAACSLFRILEFHAEHVFGVRTPACMLLFRLSPAACPMPMCEVADFSAPDAPKALLSVAGGSIRAVDADAPDLDGQCQLAWRQGVKHDCSAVMELEERDGRLLNALGEVVDVEPEMLFPLVKSSMFKAPVISGSARRVLLTQRRMGEDTSRIERDAPKAWAYLMAHADRLDGRRSVVYKGQPRFCMYGVGDYAFSLWKVGVSGFYKDPMFSVLASPDATSIQTDDTCYFLSLDSYEAAYAAMLVLNSEPVLRFYRSISFRDAKRPWTKKVLGRLDFAKALQLLSLPDLRETEARLGLPPRLDGDMLRSFRRLVLDSRARQGRRR